MKAKLLGIFCTPLDLNTLSDDDIRECDKDLILLQLETRTPLGLRKPIFNHW